MSNSTLPAVLTLAVGTWSWGKEALSLPSLKDSSQIPPLGLCKRPLTGPAPLVARGHPSTPLPSLWNRAGEKEGEPELLATGEIFGSSFSFWENWVRSELGRSPGEGKGYPLQYSGLENSMDYIVYGVTKSHMTERLSLFVPQIARIYVQSSDCLIN